MLIFWKKYIFFSQAMKVVVWDNLVHRELSLGFVVELVMMSVPQASRSPRGSMLLPPQHEGWGLRWFPSNILPCDFNMAHVPLPQCWVSLSIPFPPQWETAAVLDSHGIPSAGRFLLFTCSSIRPREAL